MNMAQKLVTLRKEKGLTQMELAEALEVSRQAVSKWELGTALPGTDKLKAIADLYEVSVDYLLNDEQDHYQPATAPLVTHVAVGKGREKLLIALCAGILAVVMAMAVALVVLVNEKVEKKLNEIETTPIGEMIIVNEDDYLDDYHDDGTFLFKEYY